MPLDNKFNLNLGEKSKGPERDTLMRGIPFRNNKTGMGTKRQTFQDSFVVYLTWSYF